MRMLVLSLRVMNYNSANNALLHKVNASCVTLSEPVGNTFQPQTGQTWYDVLKQNNAVAQPWTTVEFHELGGLVHDEEPDAIEWMRICDILLASEDADTFIAGVSILAETCRRALAHLWRDLFPDSDNAPAPVGEREELPQIVGLFAKLDGLLSAPSKQYWLRNLDEIDTLAKESRAYQYLTLMANDRKLLEVAQKSKPDEARLRRPPQYPMDQELETIVRHGQKNHDYKLQFDVLLRRVTASSGLTDGTVGAAHGLWKETRNSWDCLKLLASIRRCLDADLQKSSHSFYPITSYLLRDITSYCGKVEEYIAGTPLRPTNAMSDTLGVNSRHPRHSSVSAVALSIPKKLIVCCDGTWVDADSGWVKGKLGSSGAPQTPSNVTRIARAMKDQDDAHHQQIVYYQAGAGTGIGFYDHLVGGGTGAGLSENIREAYSFLVSNYSGHDKTKQPDSIFLVGFSRGAFTARSIGGFIGAVGILKKIAMPFFYEIFTDWANAGYPKRLPRFFDTYYRLNPELEKVLPPPEFIGKKDKINEYMQSYREILLSLNLTQEANVKCIGVWDTVGALGIPIDPILQRVFPFLTSFIREYRWYDTTIDDHVENAFQALGLDERRFPYAPAVWERPDDCRTNLKQVWFAGAHSNVGGSYADQGMADIALVWMMDQLAGHTRPVEKEYQALDWIQFDDNYIKNFHRLQVEQYQRSDKPVPAHHGWAKGRVYDSLTFLQSLAGRRIRTPGQYCRTNYATGDLTAELMHNTHEYVHASVRYRIDVGGSPIESNWDRAFPPGLSFQPYIQWLLSKIIPQRRTLTYLPDGDKGPLNKWKLIDGHADHDLPNGVLEGFAKPAKWVWTGESKIDKNELLEDVLGPYEMQLKDMDREARGVLEVSSNGVAGKVRDYLHSKTI